MSDNFLRDYDFYCPHCDKKLNYVYENKIYDTPIRSCPYCNKEYLDDRYVELACVDETPKYPLEYSVKKPSYAWIGLFILAGLCITIWFNLSLFIVSLIAGVLILVFGFIERRKKLAEYENIIEPYIIRYDKSKNRMRDRAYACRLKKSAYNVPDKYISFFGKIDEKTLNDENITVLPREVARHK